MSTYTKLNYLLCTLITTALMAQSVYAQPIQTQTLVVTGDISLDSTASSRINHQPNPVQYQSSTITYIPQHSTAITQAAETSVSEPSIYSINDTLKESLLKIVDREPLAYINAVEAFQQEADIVRLRHLEYWAGLIEEYHAKNGIYPLQILTEPKLHKRPTIQTIPLNSVQIATKKHLATLATKHRSDQRQPSYPYSSVNTHSMAELVKVLEAGLGRRIDELYDPQFDVIYKPNFYLYTTSGDIYTLTIATHKSYPFSKAVAKNYNRVAISNVPVLKENVLRPDILFSSESYRQEVNKPLARADFFNYRINKTLTDSKQH